jgi:hypothetical protein
VSRPFGAEEISPAPEKSKKPSSPLNKGKQAKADRGKKFFNGNL